MNCIDWEVHCRFPSIDPGLEIQLEPGLEACIHTVFFIKNWCLDLPFLRFQRVWGIGIYEYCFTSLSAQSWPYRDRRKPEVGTMPYSYFEWLQGFFIVHSTIGGIVHFVILNSLEHCICTTTMTNIRPTEIRGWYPQVTSPSRYEWAIGAGQRVWGVNIVCNST